MRYFLLSFFLHFTVILCSSENYYSFTNYSKADGLVHRTVQCMTQDRNGFMWIGTSNGISRFDGYNFRNYTHDNKNPFSINGIGIYGIIEGKDNKIWISTDVGLEFFDRETETFQLSNIPEIKDNKFEKNIHLDNAGMIWVYNSSTNFLAFDPQNQTIKHRITTIPGINISTVYQFIVLNDKLWISCSDGIVVYDYKKKSTNFVERKKLKHCFSIQKTNTTTLVLTFMHDGVYIINTLNETGKWIDKKVLDKHIGVKTPLFDATLDSDNSVWIGVAPGLINIKNDVISYYNNYSQEKYFDGDLVSCVYRDNENNVFFGTYQNGIYIKKKNTRFFKHGTRLYKDENKKTEITHFSVFDNRSVLYGNNKAIFFCTDYQNLNPGCAQLIFNESATSIFPIDGRYCLISTSDTIYKFDSQTKKRTRLLYTLPVSFACEDKDGIIWIGSWIGIIKGYDLKKNITYTLYVDNVKKKKIPVTSLYFDEDNSLWVGTVGMGLLHITNPKNKRPHYEQYRVNNNGENSINSNIIQSISADKSNNLWIATNGGGVSKFNKQTKIFENFTTQNGLKSNTIEALIIDKNENIWISSDVLTKYDTKNKTLTHYSEYDGVGDDFVWRQARMAIDGSLLFGNTKGILVFNPTSLPEQKKVSIPLITGLRIRGISIKVGDTLDEEVPYKKNITYSQLLTLPYSFNSFAIEFASIEIQASKIIMYEYKLEGIDNNWIPADPKSRLAAYSGLQPGKYLFKVRASNGSSGWSKTQTLYINIIPPWWLTWWFKLGIILLIIGIITFIIEYRFSIIRIQNQELEGKVLERTEELLSANDQLNKQNEQLEERQIVIEMRNLDLNDALNAKDELIKVVSHDFKNPLTVIIGMAGILKNENSEHKSKEIRQYGETILSSATSLLNQMTTVLDWAQSINKEHESNPIEINIEMLIDDAISLVQENALQKSISITKQIDFTLNAFIDPRMINTVFRNVLSNAIKYTTIGGSIHIMIQELDNSLTVAFIDTGIGIKEAILKDLFKPNVTIKSSSGTANEKGTGIGLQLCKTFIEKNFGQIRVNSEEGKGTTVTISLPKGKTAATNKSQISSISLQTSVIQPEIHDNATILVIDDNIEIREIVHSVFEGYTVLKAEDGNEGLYIAQNILPDIIICDINLPGKNGLEICRILKNNDLTCHIPILLITSNSGKEIEFNSFESGANDFIEKPFNPFSLKQKVVSLLDYRSHIRKEIQKSFETNQLANLPIDYESKTIRKVIDYINENISDPDLDTETVVEKIGISRSQLWRIFKNTTGKSLGDYIREIRMQKAAEMLRTGKYRVSEVAAEVGFFDAKNFARNFVKEFGLTPSQYIDSAKKTNTIHSK